MAPLLGHFSQSSQLKTISAPWKAMSLSLSLPLPAPFLTRVYLHLSWSRLSAAFFLLSLPFLSTLSLPSCLSTISTHFHCISFKVGFQKKNSFILMGKGNRLVKNLPAIRETWVQSWLGKITWRRERLPTPVFWPREFHGHSPWDPKESDTTE